ncbi:MAG: Fic family protein [Bdellovibrio sp.]|nr:Fic family protein [Bdellovibrio sp.]
MWDYKITLKLLENLKAITREITELNSLSFPKMVLLELEDVANAQSAYSSTSVEGNPLPLTEVKKILKTTPTNLRDTEREVINYNQALLWLKEQLSTKSFTFNSKLILETHKCVTDKLLPKLQIGKYRNEPVFVNDPKARKTIYWPPDHADVPTLMNELIKFVSDNKDKIDPIILAGLFHKQFVIIHPFTDGNGRTVRLATKAILAKLGLDTFYLFSFENYYNRNVTTYFNHVGVKGNYYDIYKNIPFTTWLEYFSGGILDELLRVRKILESESKETNPAQIVSTDQQKIIDFIKEYGHIQDKNYAKLTERAKATRALDFKKLIQLELIEKKGSGPAVYYIFKK